MSHSYTNLLYHIVFSTKERHPWLEVDVRPRLFAYIGGLIREERGIALCVNGVPDHVHLLFLPAYSPELQPAEHLWPLTNTVLVNRHFA